MGYIKFIYACDACTVDTVCEHFDPNSLKYDLYDRMKYIINVDNSIDSDVILV